MADIGQVYQAEHIVWREAAAQGRVYQAEHIVWLEGPFEAYPTDASTPARVNAALHAEASIRNEALTQRFQLIETSRQNADASRAFELTQTLSASAGVTVDIFDLTDVFGNAVVPDLLRVLVFKNTGDTTLSIGAPADGIALWSTEAVTKIPPQGGLTLILPRSYGVARAAGLIRVVNLSSTAAGSFHLIIAGESSQNGGE